MTEDNWWFVRNPQTLMKSFQWRFRFVFVNLNSKCDWLVKSFSPTDLTRVELTRFFLEFWCKLIRDTLITRNFSYDYDKKNWHVANWRILLAKCFTAVISRIFLSKLQKFDKSSIDGFFRPNIYPAVISRIFPSINYIQFTKTLLSFVESNVWNVVDQWK